MAELVARGGGALLTALALCSILLINLINFKVALIILAYILMNVLYCLKFKKTVIVDVITLAAGFILRVYAGAFAIGVPVSNFIFMTTLFLSLFLGFSKRNGELKNTKEKTRKVLEKYSSKMLEQYITISATLTIICYALYTIENSTVAKFGTNKLVYSVIFVIYGIFRYILILDKKNAEDDPTENLYQDKSLILTCLLYVLYIIVILYFKP